MDLPIDLNEGIIHLVSQYDHNALKQATKDISLRYRHLEKNTSVFLKTDLDHIAYLLTRLPATFSVLSRIFQEIQTLKADVPLQTLLDLGTGPGTSIWAAVNYFSELRQVTLIDQDPLFLKLGRHLTSYSEKPLLQNADWRSGNMLNVAVEPHDLVLVSYAFNEIKEKVRRSFIQRLWNLTRHVLIIVEPGTKQGFTNILQIREMLIDIEAHMIAPCPHTRGCPISGDDWCHFSVRLQRSQLHQKLKEASLPFEDEKYSYLVVSRSPGRQFSSRILRHPNKRKGHINFVLCGPQGIQTQIVSKKEDLLYKNAMVSRWGDIGDFLKKCEIQ